jgi:hypothetical protein
VRNSINLSAERAKGVYGEDKELPLRKSHENPSIKKLYEDHSQGTLSWTTSLGSKQTFVKSLFLVFLKIYGSDSSADQTLLLL